MTGPEGAPVEDLDEDGDAFEGLGDDDDVDDDEGDDVDPLAYSAGGGAVPRPRYRYPGSAIDCEYCGRTFRPTRSDARFCPGGRCKRAAWRGKNGSKVRNMATTYVDPETGKRVTITAEERTAALERVAAAELARVMAERDRWREKANSARNEAKWLRQRAEQHDREAVNADHAADQIEAEAKRGQQVIPGVEAKPKRKRR